MKMALLRIGALAFSFASILACGSSSSENTGGSTPTSPSTSGGAGRCTQISDCPEIVCSCAAGGGSETTVNARTCTSGQCALPKEVCPSACEWGTFGGSWTGEATTGPSAPSNGSNPPSTNGGSTPSVPQAATPCMPPTVRREGSQCAGTFELSDGTHQCAAILASSGAVICGYPCSYGCVERHGSGYTCRDGYCVPE